MPNITLADVRRFAATVPRLPHVAAKPGGIRPTADVAPRPKRLALESEADFASSLESLPRPLAGFRQMAPVRSVQCFGTGEAAEMMPMLSTNPLKPRKPEPSREMADFGRATDHHNAQLAEYRTMSPEERAEWIAEKTEAPYVPPFAKVEPRRWWNTDGTRRTS